jgi:hypothetical protein
MRLEFRVSKLSFIDFINADERALRNAFHESGHDTIAQRRSAKIDSVTIDSTGESIIEISSIGSVEDSCAIAVAGFLAEARGIACYSHRRLSRHINVKRVGELAEKIITALDTDAVIAEGRFKLIVPFFPGGRSAEEAEASVADFDDARERGMTEAHLVAALEAVSNELNEDGIWYDVDSTMQHFRTIDRGKGASGEARETA